MFGAENRYLQTIRSFCIVNTLIEQRERHKHVTNFPFSVCLFYPFRYLLNTHSGKAFICFASKRRNSFGEIYWETDISMKNMMSGSYISDVAGIFIMYIDYR